MALTCTAAELIKSTGGLQQRTITTRLALLVRYLYLQKNPTTPSTTVIPAADLLKQAACFFCAGGPFPNSAVLESMEIIIERQNAIDMGWSAPVQFNITEARASSNALANLSQSQLRAIEVMLRCQLS